MKTDTFQIRSLAVAIVLFLIFVFSKNEDIRLLSGLLSAFIIIVNVALSAMIVADDDFHKGLKALHREEHNQPK